MRFYTLCCALMLMFVTQAAFSMPSRILIIRTGETEGQNLSYRGKLRAATLPPYITQTDFLKTFGNPVAIFALKRSFEIPNIACVETVTPLAESLEITIDTSFSAEDVEKLATAIKENPTFTGKTVLVCWDNEKVNFLAEHLGVKPRPLPWPNEVFDRIWIMDFKPNSVNFRNYPQRLIYGDSFM